MSPQEVIIVVCFSTEYKIVSEILKPVFRWYTTLTHCFACLLYTTQELIQVQIQMSVKAKLKPGSSV